MKKHIFTRGQDEPNFVLWLANNILLKAKGGHKIFLLKNIFHDSKWIFCDFSAGMELESKKTKTHHQLCM